MILRVRRIALVSLFCLGGSACRTSSPYLAAASPSAIGADLSRALAQAGQEATAGRYVAADQVLADFATRYPASAEAVESIYWRAMYKLDPANSAAAAREAGVLLDSYLAAPGTARRSEAATLRRLATAMETRAAPPTADSTAKINAARSAEKSRDEELARLKDELTRANAELERIKRRLANPRP